MESESVNVLNTLDENEEEHLVETLEFDGIHNVKLNNNLTESSVDVFEIYELVNDDHLVKELSQICRCCLNKSNNLKFLYDNKNNFSDIIKTISSVQLDLNDGLPSNICLKCILKLKKCYAFRQQIQSAESKLRYYIEQGFLSGMKLEPIKINIETLWNREEDENQNNDVYYLEETDEEIIDDQNQILKSNIEIEKLSNTQDEELIEEIEVCEDDKHLLKKSIESETNDIENLEENNKIQLNSHPCKICNEFFQNEDDLIVHANEVHNHKNRKSKFKSIKPISQKTINLNKIIYKDPNNKKNFLCIECRQAFTLQNDLNIHKSIHNITDGKPICLQCNKEFTTILQLKRHIKIHFKDKPYKCAVCKKGFPEMGSLTRHFRCHTGEYREKNYACSICSKRYSDSHSLNIHTRTHTGERPWVCKICNKSFTDVRLLNSHMKVHSGAKPYKCSTCDRSFSHHSTLITHIRTHTGEKPYVCPVCGKMFIQSSNLQLHMRVHSREKPYKCNFCGKCFASSSTLTMHKRIHTGEKPYSCPICDKKFARHDISAHIRTHTGERPYSCTVCSKSFCTSTQLKKHTNTHTGFSPYTCKICQKKCSSPSYLKKHLKTHSNSMSDEDIQNLIENDGDDEINTNQIEFTETTVENNDLQNSIYIDGKYIYQAIDPKYIFKTENN